MMGFYAVRGYTPDILANLTATERIFLHRAREQYYEELSEILKVLA